MNDLSPAGWSGFFLPNKKTGSKTYQSIAPDKT
jgi:hypothetical protein